MMLRKVSNYTLMTLIIFLLCFAILLSTDAALSVDTIQGMWTFEEGSGTTVMDLSGNGSDGIISGDLKWVDAKFGSGLEFSGIEAQNHVRIGTKGDPDSLAALNFKDSEGFSIHAWVFASAQPNGKCVVWKGIGCSSWSQYFLGTGAHENPGGRINQASFFFRTSSSPDKFQALGDPLPVNEWVHLVGVWDGTRIHIYVNGELQNSGDAAGQPWDSPEPVYIGMDTGCNAGKGRCHWQGIIDEIVIFNVPLSDDDVKALGDGIETVTAVEAAGKITTKWGKIKASE